MVTDVMNRFTDRFILRSQGRPKSVMLHTPNVNFGCADSHDTHSGCVGGIYRILKTEGPAANVSESKGSSQPIIGGIALQCSCWGHMLSYPVS